MGRAGNVQHKKETNITKGASKLVIWPKRNTGSNNSEKNLTMYFSKQKSKHTKNNTCRSEHSAATTGGTIRRWQCTSKTLPRPRTAPWGSTMRSTSSRAVQAHDWNSYTQEWQIPQSQSSTESQNGRSSSGSKASFHYSGFISLFSFIIKLHSGWGDRQSSVAAMS